MLDLINSIFADVAYNAAIYSAGLASHNGMYQLNEPKELKEFATKANNGYSNKGNLR